MRVKSQSVNLRRKLVRAGLLLSLLLLPLYCYLFVRDDVTEMCILTGEMRDVIEIAGIPAYRKCLDSEFARVADVNSPRHVWKPISRTSIRIWERCISDYELGRDAVRMRIMLNGWREMGLSNDAQRKLAREVLKDLQNRFSVGSGGIEIGQ